MSDEVFNDDGSLRCNLCRNEPCTCGRQPVRAETMSDDLVERLRWWGTERCGQPDGTLCDEAADEIDSLRAKLAEAERAKGEPIAWMVGTDPESAAIYNAGEKEEAFDAARRWKTSITGLVPCDGAPIPSAAPPAPSLSVQAERPIELPPDGVIDDIAMKHWPRSWVEIPYLQFARDVARAAVELDRSKR